MEQINATTTFVQLSANMDSKPIITVVAHASVKNLVKVSIALQVSHVSLQKIQNVFLVQGFVNQSRFASQTSFTPIPVDMERL